MNIRNDLQGLQQIFPSQSLDKAGSAEKPQGVSATVTRADQTTLSSAASLAAQTAADSDVRMEKVTEVQKALAAGTYGVPAPQVADKMIDRMLGK